MRAAALPSTEQQGANYLFPPKTGPKGRQPKTPGAPKTRQVNFRPPPDIEAYLRQNAELGYSRTEVILKLLYLAKGALDELGSLWWDIEKAANQGGTPHGKALGQYAALGLRAKK